MRSKRVWLALLAVSAMALAEDARDGSERVLILPLCDLQGACCDAAVEKALAALKEVESVRILALGDARDAALTLKGGSTLRLSDVSKALDRASEGMKAEGMDVHYQLAGERFSLDMRSDVLVANVQDETGLRTALFKGVQRLDGAFVTREEDLVHVRLRPAGSAVSFIELVDAVRAMDGEVVDVIVAAPAAAGAAPPADSTLYRCTMDGGERATPGPCPKCGMALGEEHRVVAGAPREAANHPSPPRGGAGPNVSYTCPMCGGAYGEPGTCPRCDMPLVRANPNRVPGREPTPPAGGGC